MVIKLEKMFLSSEAVYNKANNLIKEASRLAKEKNFELAIFKIEKALKYETHLEWIDKLANYYYKNGNATMAHSILEEYKANQKSYPLNDFGYDIWYFDRKRIWEKDKTKKERYNLIIELKRLMSDALNGENLFFGVTFHNKNFQSYFDETLIEIKEDLYYLQKKYLKTYDYHYEHYLELEKFETTIEYIDHCFKNDLRYNEIRNKFENYLNSINHIK